MFQITSKNLQKISLSYQQFQHVVVSDHQVGFDLSSKFRDNFPKSRALGERRVRQVRLQYHQQRWKELPQLEPHRCEAVGQKNYGEYLVCASF
jgi:hypothetical protein